jgi:hypothetical protein
MRRRTTGVSFVAISAFLFATRFLTAAIWGSGVQSWNADLFSSMLEYVDQGLSVWSLVALVIGLVYLVWAEIDNIRS